MDLVIVGGGLGNQMSQFAFYYCKAVRGSKVKLLANPQIVNDHNGYELDSVFNINYLMTSAYESYLYTILYYILASKKSNPLLKYIRSLPFLRNWRYCQEPYDYFYNESYAKPAAFNRLFVGGWHSYEYYRDFVSDLRNIFAFDKSKVPSCILTWLSDLPASRPIVGIHVRKGDYLAPPNLVKFGSVCDSRYYLMASSYIKSVYSNPVFILFTNDLGWCKEHLTGIDYLIPPPLPCSMNWVSMYLMQYCDALVTSNSTFSWWGAFLSTRASLVVRPSEFIAGVSSHGFYPPSWVVIQ